MSKMTMEPPIRTDGIKTALKQPEKDVEQEARAELLITAMTRKKTNNTKKLRQSCESQT
jgi:hypothetical protein